MRAARGRSDRIPNPAAHPTTTTPPNTDLAPAFETQHVPDSPNHPEYPTVILQPGQKFHSTTIFAFATDAKAAQKPAAKR
ncbi:MAG TPA: hypothetical protein VN682_26010 [Terriglobales bacterium]|nr:hypothetical protein [Terriglobales bacterium]